MSIIVYVAQGVTIVGGATGLGTYFYRRGRASGKREVVLEAEKAAQAEAKRQEQAKVQALEGQVAQIQAELDALRGQQQAKAFKG